MKKSFLFNCFIFGLCACFAMNVIVEDLKAGEKPQGDNDIKVLYRQAIGDYKHGCLPAARIAFEKILALDGSQMKARYFLEYRIPRKLVEQEAKKQESLRVEQFRVIYEKKKRASQVAREEGLAGRHHDADIARLLFANGHDK